MANDDLSVEVVTSNDLFMVRIGGRANVRIYLPGDLRASDTISGAIEVDAEQGSDIPLGLRISQTEVPLTEGFGRWKLAEGAEPSIPASVIDDSGGTLRSFSIPAFADGRPSGPSDESSFERGYVGSGVVVIPVIGDGDASAFRPHLDPQVRILAASPRKLVVFDGLIISAGPQRVTCCSEGGPCGPSSCCVDIPSTSCTFCSFAGYSTCLAVGPVP